MKAGALETERRIMWKIGFAAAVLVVVGAACDEVQTAQPCDRYVDYMCDCHGADPGFDCEELTTVFADADPELQDQCSIDLGDQQDDDDASGHVCDDGSGI